MAEQETYEQYLLRCYPKAKYHVSFPPTIAYSPAEEEKLGPQWVDHPDLVNKPFVQVVSEVVAQADADLRATTGLSDVVPKRRGRPPKEKTE